MGDQNPPPEISITPPETTGFPLTKEFLELTFEKDVDTFTVNVGTNPGDNYLSIIHAVEVKFSGEDAPGYYLVKCYPNHQGRRDFLDQTNVFNKELFMYSEFLPELQKIAEESEHPDVALSLAPFHGGNVVDTPSKKFNVNPWRDENFIVMTDLRKTSQCRMANRVEGLDWDHTVLMVKELAKLHALSWAYTRKNGLESLIQKYPSFMDQMYSHAELMESFSSMMDQINQNALKAAEDGLGSDHPAFLNFKKYLLGTDVFDLMKKCVPPDGIIEDDVESFLRIKPKEDENYYKGPWRVGTHGDAWLNNALFTYENESAKPTKVTMVDFQIFREACPTIDLTYFLSSSVRAPLRIPRLDEILKIYHDNFLFVCKAVKVSPLPGFTLDTLKRKYNRAKLFGLIVSLPMLSIVLKPPEDSVDLDTAAKGEGMTEIFSSVLEGSGKNTRFRDELSANILDLYENGVI